jgi:hypothetical protein
MKVNILSYHAVAAWRWNMPEDDDCGICRVQFDGTCPKCKFPGDDCPISMYSSWQHYQYHADLSPVMGQCTHSFHMVRLRGSPFLTDNTNINKALSRYLDQSRVKSGQMSHV